MGSDFIEILNKAKRICIYLNFGLVNQAGDFGLTSHLNVEVVFHCLYEFFLHFRVINDERLSLFPILSPVIQPNFEDGCIALGHGPNELFDAADNNESRDDLLLVLDIVVLLLELRGLFH